MKTPRARPTPAGDPLHWRGQEQCALDVQLAS